MNASEQMTMQGRGTRGLSSFWLKIIAIAGMTANHFAYIFQPHLSLPLQCVLFALGGLTFPILGFLLVEGYRHTSSVKRYGLRLFAFALLAQAPFWVFLDHKGNVLFTLLLCLIMLWALDSLKGSPLGLAVAAACVGASYACDWGVIGPVLVLVFAKAEGSLTKRAFTAALMPAVVEGFGSVSRMVSQHSLAMLPFFFYGVIGAMATVPLIGLYNGQRGKSLKWFFYAYYPAHIAALGLLRMALGL